MSSNMTDVAALASMRDWLNNLPPQWARIYDDLKRIDPRVMPGRGALERWEDDGGPPVREPRV